VRRSLPALLSGLLIVSPLAGPAQACWRQRRAEPCGPVILVAACPPVHWDACCEPTGELMVAEAVVIEEVACPPVSACCGEAAAVEHEHEPVATGSVVELESVATPPVLAPAGEEASVLRASNEEPTAADEAVSAVEPTAEPATQPLEPDDGVPTGEPSPVAPEPTMPELDLPEPTIAEPTIPEPIDPEPAPAPPQPAPPEDDNFFEELDAEEDAAAADEAALLDQTAEPTAAAAEPLMPDPFSAGEEPAVQPLDEPAAEPADQPVPDPFAEPLDEDSAEPDPEPVAPEDDVVRVEPSRRWIDATGTVSLVARLIEVAPDGRCLVDSGGRRLLIPIAKLSPYDRDYVEAARGRLAGAGGERVVTSSRRSLATASR
jgi:hypothetical protein